MAAPMIDNVAFCLRDGGLCLLEFGQTELHSDSYLAWMNDLAVTRTLGRFDYLMPVDRAKLVAYFEAIDRTNTVFLAIYLGTEGQIDRPDRSAMQFIGTIKLYDIDLLARRASIGVAIGDRAKWGQGYSSHAIRIVCRYAFETLGMRKITAGYVASNVAMERAFLKNGFEVEAVFRKHLYYEGAYVDHKFVCKFGSGDDQ